MDIRRFRALRAAVVSIAEIARETGHDWKTVKKYWLTTARPRRRRRHPAPAPSRG